MQVKGHRRIEAEPAAITAALADPAALERILPSCEGVSSAGPGRFDCTFARKAGPMTLRLRADLTVTPTPGDGRTLVLQGRSAVAGSVKAVCTLDLRPVAGGTRVEYALAVETGGMIGRLAGALAPEAAEKGALRLMDRLKTVVEGEV